MKTPQELADWATNALLDMGVQPHRINVAPLLALKQPVDMSRTQLRYTIETDSGVTVDLQP